MNTKITKIIDAAWEKKSPVVEWLKFEGDIRTVLEEFRVGEVTALEAVMAIDELVAGHTRRGSVL
uniref:Uncharacterized protein n=1 Tax=viral metagenome TaxID=1070528 RepID=A0A6M3JWM4_9ZZZZ